MNLIERFFYQNGIMKFNEVKLDRWNRSESIDKIIFAAKNGMYNIRLKCIKLLSDRLTQTEVKTLLTSMILDNIEVVSEAAIKALEATASTELNKQIQEIRKERKAREKDNKVKSYMANIQFRDTGKARPSERLMNRLRDQQRANQPPY